MKTPPHRTRLRRAIVALGLVASVALVTEPASATPSTDLLYSTDGGATWSSNVHVAPGGTVLVRQWFDSDLPTAANASRLSTGLPAGFTLGSAPTQVCLNPSTTDPTAPDASEQVCTTAAPSVWSGSVLTVSPSAGFFGASNAATLGTLAPGRQKYLSLLTCNTTLDRVARRETVSGTIDLGYREDGTSAYSQAFPSAAADPGGSDCVLINRGYGPSSATSFQGPFGAQAMTTLANRWLTVDECHWVYANGRSVDSSINPTTGIFFPAGFATGTSLSPTNPGGGPTCGSGASGATFLPDTATRTSFDVLNNRYLRMAQCRWQSIDAANRHWLTTWASNGGAAGSDALTEPSDPSSWTCTNPDRATLEPDASGQVFEGVNELDLFDPSRARGYVRYEVVAPSAASPEDCLAGLPPFDQQSTLSTGMFSRPAVAPRLGQSSTSSGTITVDWLPGICPNDPSPITDPSVALGVTLVGGAATWVWARRKRSAAR